MSTVWPLVIMRRKAGVVGVLVCGFQLKKTKTTKKDAALRVQVLAVVFVHFILSGILALEANMLM